MSPKHVHACIHAQSLQSCLTLCGPMDCSSQAPLSMKFSRQEYQSELPFLPPGDLPNPEIEPESTVSPVFQGDSLLTEPLGKLTFSVEPRALLCRGSNREA